MTHPVHLFFGILIFATASAASCANSPRYTRTECITKVKLYWPSEMSAMNREKTIDEVFSIEKKMQQTEHKLPIAGFGIRNADRSDFYVQYRDSCASKNEMTNDFFRRLAHEISQFPKYEVSNEIVVPSPKTIDMRGSSWVDGMPLHTPEK